MNSVSISPFHNSNFNKWRHSVLTSAFAHLDGARRRGEGKLGKFFKKASTPEQIRTSKLLTYQRRLAPRRLELLNILSRSDFKSAYLGGARRRDEDGLGEVVHERVEN